MALVEPSLADLEREKADMRDLTFAGIFQSYVGVEGISWEKRKSHLCSDRYSLKYLDIDDLALAPWKRQTLLW